MNNAVENNARNLSRARLLVDVHQNTAPWAIKDGEEVVERGTAINLEEVRQVQIDRNIRTVLIDANFRTQEVEEAAFHYGWFTCRPHSDFGRAGQLEILEANERPAPNPEPTPALAAAFMRGFNSLAALVHSTAREKGWWDTERNNGEILCLIHSEVSEALEAIRVGNPPDDKIPEFTGVEAELADVVIRIMDLAPARNWRVAEAVLAKIAFNTTRDRMHGGKLF